MNTPFNSLDSAKTVIGFAILGLFATGTAGVLKASEMKQGFDVLCCLLGAAVSFGTVLYIYLRKD